MKDYNIKRLFLGGLFFLLGIIVTIAITKYSNKIFPDDPMIVKEIQDTLHVVHEFKTDENSTINNKIFDSRKELIKKSFKEELINLKELKSEHAKVDSTIKQLKNEISQENKEIFKNTYNDIIEVKTIFPNWKGGYMTSGQTSNFEFECPKDKTSEYIGLKVKFLNSSLVDRIACLYISVHKTNYDNNKKLYYTNIFEQGYTVKSGLNIIRIKNYLKDINVELLIGYFLKAEANKEYPRFEKITCKSS